MRCALVFYFVLTLFVIVYSLPELCEIRGYEAHCARADVDYTLDFIPPIAQNIASIKLVGQPLKQLPYNAFRNVSSQSTISNIWLQQCQISHVDADALLNLHNLITIDLSYNQINQVDSKLFSHTKQIKYIFLQYNKIKVFPNGLFQNLPQLEAVYLNDNRIRQVESFSFKNTPSLQHISFANNQIEFIDVSFKDQFDDLTILALFGNPWKCNCELGPLYELLIKINQLNHKGLVCEEPPTLHGRSWSEISRDEFVCSAEDAISVKEADAEIPVTVYNGTKYQPIDIGIPQPPSNPNWIPYTISGLVLVGIVAVIIGVRLFERISDRRTNSGNVDNDLSKLVVQSSAVSENNDSRSNMAASDEKSTSIHHCEIREATTN